MGLHWTDTMSEKMKPTPPTTVRPTVYHVGDLDGERPSRSFSNEGGELSVSEHPDVWRRISHAHGTTYELTRPDAEFYEADPTGPRDVVREWCRANGYVHETRAWKGVWYDPEIDDNTYIIKFSRETARREAQVDVREDAHVESTTALTLAERGRAYWSAAFNSEPQAADPVQVAALAPIWYAHDALDVEGVWWPERLSPENYSAPRGAIFQDRLDGWEISPVGDAGE